MQSNFLVRARQVLTCQTLSTWSQRVEKAKCFALAALMGFLLATPQLGGLKLRTWRVWASLPFVFCLLWMQVRILELQTTKNDAN